MDFSWLRWPSWSTSQQQPPMNGMSSTTANVTIPGGTDGVMGGRKRKSKKTRRGGKKSRKSKPSRK